MLKAVGLVKDKVISRSGGREAFAQRRGRENRHALDLRRLPGGRRADDDYPTRRHRLPALSDQACRQVCPPSCPNRYGRQSWRA